VKAISLDHKPIALQDPKILENCVTKLSTLISWKAQTKIVANF